jgi:hypothetical protein
MDEYGIQACHTLSLTLQSERRTQARDEKIAK